MDPMSELTRVMAPADRNIATHLDLINIAGLYLPGNSHS